MFGILVYDMFTFWICSSQQGSLRRIRSLGALGEGSGWDLRIRPAPAPAAPPPAASGNLGAIFLEKKKAPAAAYPQA